MAHAHRNRSRISLFKVIASLWYAYYACHEHRVIVALVPKPSHLSVIYSIKSIGEIYVDYTLHCMSSINYPADKAMHCLHISYINYHM